jgi:hypothetical protein
MLADSHICVGLKIKNYPDVASPVKESGRIWSNHVKRHFRRLELELLINFGRLVVVRHCGKSLHKNYGNR